MNFVKAREVLKRHDRTILTKTKNVNGVTIEKVGHSWCINVLVTKRLRSHRWLEKLRLSGLSVSVKQVGVIQAHQSRTSKWRPAPGGVSIAHPDATAGTLGCTVYKGSKKYILSNNHILAVLNNADIGDPIYQPGPYDGGTSSDQIGVLHDYIPLVFESLYRVNYVDCALCEPDNAADVLDTLLGLGLPNGEKEAKIGEVVTKSGRTTAVTENTITEFSGLLSVLYSSGQRAYFDDQIVTGVMSAGGDSGSLLINQNTKKVVGLVFAGSPSITVSNRATRVAEELGIRFYGESEKVLDARYDILPFESCVKFYRCAVWTEGDTHGGDIDILNEILSGTIQNVFDDVSNAERVTGDVEYRKVYIKNENVGSGSLWESIKLWIGQFTPSEDDEVWITVEGTNSDTQATAKDYTYYQPAGRDHADAQDIGSLASGEYHHVWIKRQVSAGSASFSGNSFVLAFGTYSSSSGSSSLSSSSSTSSSSTSSCFSSSSSSSFESLSYSSSSISSSSAPPNNINQGAYQILEQGAWQSQQEEQSSSSSSTTSQSSSSSSSSSVSSSSSGSSSVSSSSSSSHSAGSSSTSSSSAQLDNINQGVYQILEQGAWQSCQEEQSSSSSSSSSFSSSSSSSSSFSSSSSSSSSFSSSSSSSSSFSSSSSSSSSFSSSSSSSSSFSSSSSSSSSFSSSSSSSSSFSSSSSASVSSVGAQAANTS